jgi:3-O-alpha-D-mannopyranosyl-alpha-D-mannopyranose xylosylphosphotransferase
MDGHMPPIVKPGFPSNKGDKCVLDLERCFGSFWTKESNMTAADMFTRLSFQNPECGDCCE